MAEIHVQARKHQANPGWMWAWIVLGILVIAAVVYIIYVNKNKNNQNNKQELQNQRSTPVSLTEPLQQFADNTYVMDACA